MAFLMTDIQIENCSIKGTFTVELREIIRNRQERFHPPFYRQCVPGKTYKFVVLNSGKKFNFIIYNKPTRCTSGSIVFINNYKYALHISDALCFHHQEHYKL